jgi:4-carboxymuconolactone decarboxylase
MLHSIKLLKFLTIVFAAFTFFGCSTVKTYYQKLTDEAPMTEARYNASLPEDVYPESRGRLPIVNRAELDDEGKAAYDRYMSPNSTSLAGIQGPGGLRLHATADKSPSKISAKIRELVRLVIAREMDQQFEWTLHEPVALREGLDPGIIEVIRRNRPLRNVTEPEASVIQLGREVFQDHRVSSETYARLTQHFGKKDLIEITQLMGGGMNSFILLFMFDVHLPYDREPLLTVD